MRKQIVGLLLPTVIFSISSMYGMKRSSAYEIENSNFSNVTLPPMVYPGQMMIIDTIQLPPMDYSAFQSHNKKRKIDTVGSLEYQNSSMQMDYVYPNIEQNQLQEVDVSKMMEVVKGKKISKKKSAASTKNRSRKQLYLCREKNCRYQTAFGRNMITHERLHCEGGIYEVCQECDFLAGSERAYNTHMRSHSDILERDFNLLSVKTPFHKHVFSKK
jgi:hypothetical protein